MFPTDKGIMLGIESQMVLLLNFSKMSLTHWQCRLKQHFYSSISDGCRHITIFMQLKIDPPNVFTYKLVSDVLYSKMMFSH